MDIPFPLDLNVSNYLSLIISVLLLFMYPADIDCPVGYMKCRRAYCIPLHSICDQIIDCPQGEDELNCYTYRE